MLSRGLLDWIPIVTFKLFCLDIVNQQPRLRVLNSLTPFAQSQKRRAKARVETVRDPLELLAVLSTERV